MPDTGVYGSWNTNTWGDVKKTQVWLTEDNTYRVECEDSKLGITENHIFPTLEEAKQFSDNWVA